jgi:hypothetical protein
MKIDLDDIRVILGNDKICAASFVATLRYYSNDVTNYKGFNFILSECKTYYKINPSDNQQVNESK